MSRKNQIKRWFWKNIGGQNYWTVDKTDRPVVFEDFGCLQPTDLSDYLLWKAHRKDYDTAIKADITKQNYSVMPRCWYVDAWFYCEECGQEFCWAAKEQKRWFEDYTFYVQSQPRKCPTCRQKWRVARDAKLIYDKYIHTVCDQSTHPKIKQQVIDAVDQIEQMAEIDGKKLSPAYGRTRRTLMRQLNNHE